MTNCIRVIVGILSSEGYETYELKPPERPVCRVSQSLRTIGGDSEGSESTN